MKQKSKSVKVLNLDLSKITNAKLEKLANDTYEILRSEVESNFSGSSVIEVEPNVYFEINDMLNVIIDIEVRSTLKLSPEVEAKIEKIINNVFRRIENELLTEFIKQ